MQKIILLTVFFFLGMAWGVSLHAQTPAKIEDRIYQAFEQSFVKGTSSLESILQELATSYESEPKRQWAYWQGYAHYYLSIYQLKMGKKNEANAVLQQGIQILEGIRDKNSDDYALLSALQSFSITYNPSEAPVLSTKALKNIEKAIELDGQNLRAYLIAGRNDFYKPEQYGGGKVTEKHLLKALSLKDSYQTDNSYTPSWGRSEAYALLVQFYQREGRKEEALLFCKQGLQKFPNDYMLNQLQKEL